MIFDGWRGLIELLGKLHGTTAGAWEQRMRALELRQELADLMAAVEATLASSRRHLDAAGTELGKGEVAASWARRPRARGRATGGGGGEDAGQA